MKTKSFLVALVALLALAPAATFAQTAAKLSAEQAREETAYALGVQAYLWGVPLVEYSHTLAAGTKVDGVRINDFRKFTALKTAKDRFIVTPNNVTLDAYCAFDVTDEPVVVFVPKLNEDRWYIVQYGDHFDEIFHVGGGTKGQQPGVYLITGPDFNGIVPGDMTQLASRTKMGALGVRVFVKGEADVASARAAQAGFRVMPLSAYLKYGLAYQAPKSAQLETVPVAAPAELRFFEEMGYWMHRWLAVSSDASDTQIASFHPLGLSVAKGFDWRNIDEPTKRGLVRAIKSGGQIVDAAWEATGEKTNGWKYTFAGGRAGYDLALRAALAKYVLGALLADQVIYPNTTVDDKGEQLTGTRKYVLHFDAGKLPPVSVFWNMAMYASDMLFVENDFGRVSIGSTTDGLKKNADGSLDILIQKDRPADTSNWLPAPAGDFNLTFRFYGPETPVLDGSYRLPAVKRVP